ncbi:MAG: DUF6510 family protein [Chloroflexota bacterium]
MEERMALMRDDPAVDLTIDGTGAGGLLAEIFGVEMTAAPGQCAHCHTVSVVGTMRVYMRGPGVILRCPACSEVVLRIVRTPRGTLVDARGAAYLVVDRG